MRAARACGVCRDGYLPGLYRSVLAQAAGQVLVIADNASSEEQIRLLLPGAGPHKMLVTSQHTLAGLRPRRVDVTILGQASQVRGDRDVANTVSGGTQYGPVRLRIRT